MIKAYAYPGDHTSPDRVAISIVRYSSDEGSRPAHILRLSGGAEGVLPFQNWEEIDDHASTRPTLKLPYPEALALSEALSELFHGTGEYRALRKDYEAERRRVGTLTQAVIAAIGTGAKSVEPDPWSGG